MTFIPPYARTNSQAVIAQAFEPRTLAGLAGLGCGCAGAAGSRGVMRDLAGLRGLRGLGAAGDSCIKMEFQDGYYIPVQTTDCDGTSSSTGNVVNPAPVNTAVAPAPTSGVCDSNPSVWGSGVAVNGKCYAYCTADPTQYYEMTMDQCVRGGGGGAIPGNVILIGAVTLGVILMLMQ